MQKKPLLIILVLFIAPILVAKLVLVNGWYQGAQTNVGELLTSPLTISSSPPAWLLLYNPNDECSQQCQQSLWQIQQVHTLLASEGERVQRYLTKYPTPNLSEQSSTVSKHVDITTLKKLQLRDLNQNQLSADTLYLVDPLGNIFMHYQFPVDNAAALKVSAGLLKDLKRLLKISKIG